MQNTLIFKIKILKEYIKYIISYYFVYKIKIIKLIDSFI